MQLTPADRSLGGQRGGKALRDKCRRIREEREREIVRIVRRAGGPKETVAAYGEYVQVAAEHGWPIVGYRRFNQYLAVLEERGLLRRTVVVGHGGSLSMVETTGGGPGAG